MKNHFRFSILAVLFSLAFILDCNAQEKKASFEISFSIDRNSTALKCADGCTWNNLFIKSKSFHLNQTGMATIENNKDEVNRSEFLIGVTRKGNKFILTGKKGTNWKTLTFEVSNKDSKVVVDEDGVKVSK